MTTLSSIAEAVAARGLSFEQIRKRDGRIVPFDGGRIVNAILKAGQATGEFELPTAQQMTTRVLAIAQSTLSTELPTVEQIQDIVEEVLLASPFKKTAKAYLLYRDQHARIREMVRQADVDLIEQYLKRLDWRVKENSNMAYSLQGLNNYIASHVSEVYWLNKIYTPEVREAHLGGDLHLHDLGLLSAYCVGWDLGDLLRSGFRGVSGKAESGPARHFRSALGQDRQFLLYPSGRSRRRTGLLKFRYVALPLHPLRRVGLPRSQAGHPGVCIQCECAYARRFPDTFYQRHHGSETAMKYERAAGNHRRRSKERDVRRVCQGDGAFQPGFSGSTL